MIDEKFLKRYLAWIPTTLPCKERLLLLSGLFRGASQLNFICKYPPTFHKIYKKQSINLVFFLWKPKQSWAAMCNVCCPQTP